MPTIRSRILENFPKECLIELNKLRKNKTIYNNNDKVKVAYGIMDKYGVDYTPIGEGTNRLAIYIDGYIFKIAMDDEGWRDNRNEYIISPMLYPKVLKAYETNSLISVFEYVTLISADEYAMRGDEILEILEELSKEYLFGDIGYIKKNFQNWGYRSDNELVILDYAYMYKIYGHMIICHDCGKTLYFNRDYSELVCHNCGKKHNFWQVRKKIGMDRIDNFIADELSESVRMTTVSRELDPAEYENILIGDPPELEEKSIYTKKGAKAFMKKLKKYAGLGDSWMMDNTDPFSSFENLSRAVEGYEDSHYDDLTMGYESYDDFDSPETFRLGTESYTRALDALNDGSLFEGFHDDESRRPSFKSNRGYDVESEEDFETYVSSTGELTQQYVQKSPVELIGDVIEYLIGHNDVNPALDGTQQILLEGIKAKLNAQVDGGRQKISTSPASEKVAVGKNKSDNPDVAVSVGVKYIAPEKPKQTISDGEEGGYFS